MYIVEWYWLYADNNWGNICQWNIYVVIARLLRNVGYTDVSQIIGKVWNI